MILIKNDLTPANWRKLIVPKSICLIVALTIFASGRAYAGAPEKKFILNKDDTYVGFDIGYLVLGRVNGHFDDFQGSFIIDREHPKNNRADIIIKTASVNTGIETRDEDIRGPDLFNTNRYPTMAFHSRKIEMLSDNTAAMTGNLTLLGVTKSVAMNLIRIPGPGFQKVAKNKNSGESFKVTGKIKRSDFGMTAYEGPIGNIVTLYICYNMLECGNEHMNQYKTNYKYNN